MKIIVEKAGYLSGKIVAPASKSYTQRMVITSALSEGTSHIYNPLYSEDTEAALRAVTALGAQFKADDACWVIKGTKPQTPKGPIDCGESGAILRFIIPVSALANSSSTLLFRGSIDRRPVEPLLTSLKQLGANAYVGKQGLLDAVYVKGGGIIGGQCNIPGNISSQFISGLMLACPLAEAKTVITLTSPLESADYVKMTETVLTKHAIIVGMEKRRIVVPSNQKYKATDSNVPGDFSSAAFILAAAAITNSKVTINNINHEMVQGDKAILTILKRMGVEGKVCPDSIEIEGSEKPLSPINIDVKNIPDLVPVIAVLACYAKGISHITGAKRLCLKESNRLFAIYEALGKMGANITITEDTMSINGTSLHGAVVDPHNDHRIAMAASIAALGAEGQTTIEHAECIRKSYPQFYVHLKQLGVNMVGGKLDR
ncbi:MAG: 3-phosphoshikimate 1-carboxyvinyltransferase [Candidatus Bathyarchaeia archaeon]